MFEQFQNGYQNFLSVKTFNSENEVNSVFS